MKKIYKCGHCGYKGRGQTNGFSAPWCPQCERNDKFDLIESDKLNSIFNIYKEQHSQGNISIENIPPSKIINGDLGIQISADGRVWICIDGVAFVRFKPTLECV